MARVNAAARKRLPVSAFADTEHRKFLIHDVTHARLAWQMLDRHQWTSAAEKSRAKSRILAALRRFGVNTKNYKDQKLSAETLQNLSMAEVSVLYSMMEHDFGLVHHGDHVQLADSLPAVEDGNDTWECEHGAYDAEMGCCPHCMEECTAELPEQPMLRVPIARVGVWYHPAYGIVSFSQADFDQMMANFERDELGFPPFMRYGHDRGKPNVADDEPKRGDIVALSQDGDVLYSYIAPYDSQVVEDIRNRRYTHSSAELTRNAESKRDGTQIGTLLKAISLTNSPFVPNMPMNEVLSQSATTGAADEEFTWVFSNGVGVGSMVTWSNSGGPARGKIVSIHDEGRVPNLEGNAKVIGAKNDPAARIQIYREGKPTDVFVGHRLESLQKLSDDDTKDGDTPSGELLSMAQSLVDVIGEEMKKPTVLQRFKEIFLSAFGAGETASNSQQTLSVTGILDNDNSLVEVHQRFSTGNYTQEDILTIEAFLPEDTNDLVDSLKNQLASLSQDQTITLSNSPSTYPIPDAVQAAARRGLELRKEFGRGGTAVGISSARRLAAGGSASEEFVRKVARYFPRHANDNLDEKGTDGKSPSNGWIAWLLWGGNPGRTWSEAIVKRLDKQEDQKMSNATAEAILPDVVSEDPQESTPSAPQAADTTLVETGTQEETVMSEQPKAEGPSLEMVQELANQMKELQQQFSNALAENAELKTKLGATEAALEVTKQTAEMLSNNLVSQKREELKQALIRDRIPPAVVEEAFSLAAAIPVNEIKLSDGASTDPYQALATLLRKLPDENRIQLGQIGATGHQNFSNSEGDSKVIYGEQLKQYFGDKIAK